MIASIVVHDAAHDVAIVAAGSAPYAERGAPMPREDAAEWLHREVAFGQLDAHALARLHALIAPGTRAPGVTELEREIGDALAHGRLLALVRPHRSLVVPLETGEIVLGPEDDDEYGAHFDRSRGRNE